MRHALLVGLVVCLFLLGSPAVPARAAGFTVNSPLDAPDANPGDGVCATAAGLCTLRAAIQEANATPAADTVSVPPGTYLLTLTGRGEDFATAGDLDIRQPLSILGAGAANTVIDGNGADRIFHVIGPISLQLSGLTLRNGNVPRPADISADGGGGAIYVVGGGSLTLNNVVASANTATSGAIAIDDGGSLTVTGSTISGNTTSFGGGIFSNGRDTVTNTTLSGNTASSSGGAIYQRLGSVSVVNSTISGNAASSSAVGGGGLLVAAGASATIAASLLNANSANNNGGAIHSRGSLSLANATLSGNTARGSGGGIYAGGGSATLSNATLAANSADVQGGAVVSAGSSITVRNTILSTSAASGNCGGQITSLGYNLDSGQTCSLNGPGDLVSVNPQLGSLQNNGGTTMTHALLPGSPAIDAGNQSPPGSGGTVCEATDQRGQRRPTDGNGDGVARCDIGAFEAATATAPIGPIPVLVNPQMTIGPGASAPTAMPIVVPTVLAPPPVPRAPTPVITPVRVPAASAPAVAPPEEAVAYVLVVQDTEALSVEGDPLDGAEPGGWYVLLAEQDGWLLVASNPDWPIWIADDERVEVHRP